MPIIRTPLEMLAYQLGEAINDDVAAWGVDSPYRNSTAVVLTITTRDGRTYEWVGVEVPREGDVR
jgi:hypothetical protein